MQLNSITNGCSYGENSCPWWLQSILFLDNGSQIGQSSKGHYAHDIALEQWNGGNGPYFCQYNLPTFVNIDQVGYSSVIQSNLDITCGKTCTYKIEFTVTITNSNGQTVSTSQDLCTAPLGNVIYFTQVEGVVVGPAGGYHSTFKPLNTEIFSGYIDLVSSFNLMSSKSVQITQTGESSNLHQDVWNAYSESYGSLYLYTVESYQKTETTN